MSREKEELLYTINGPIPIQDPVSELQSRGASGGYQYLLAWADDGVIWGIYQDGSLILSSDKNAFPEYSPLLREETLWEARLFGEKAEWYLWRSDDGFLAREVTDGQGVPGVAFSESLILWGTDLEQFKSPFSLVREADLGIRHTPPAKLKARHTIRLLVRHYLDYDSEGAAFVRLSRLVDLSNSGGER